MNLQEEDNILKGATEALNKATKNLGKEKLKAIADEVIAMNLGGPTLEEYFQEFESNFQTENQVSPEIDLKDVSGISIRPFAETLKGIQEITTSLFADTGKVRETISPSSYTELLTGIQGYTMEPFMKPIERMSFERLSFGDNNLLYGAIAIPGVWSTNLADFDIDVLPFFGKYHWVGLNFPNFYPEHGPPVFEKEDSSCYPSINDEIEINDHWHVQPVVFYFRFVLTSFLWQLMHSSHLKITALPSSPISVQKAKIFHLT